MICNGVTSIKTGSDKIYWICKMKPAFVLSAAVVFNLLCYSISSGKPQQETALEGNDDNERRAFAYASSSVKIIPDAMPQTGYGPVLVPGSLLPVQPALSECYACTDCPQVLPNTTIRQCGYDAARCVVYTEKYKHLANPIYIRGCVSERGTCNDVKKAHEGHQNVVQLLSCEECFGDKCNTNGVPKSLPNLTSALFFIIVCPMITKFTLS